MARPQLELADIFRQYGEEYRNKYGRVMSSEHRRVMQAIERCRTSALGGHVDECDACGHRVISYNSCRNRHCPKCQSLAKAQWLDARKAEILPVGYYHVVFTLPELLAPLALQNKTAIYNILFHAASSALLTIASDPQHLGADIGFVAVLHTWGQNLMHHPHVHCVVTGGGLSPDKRRWVPCRKRFFLSVKVLSRIFRRLFLHLLDNAFTKGELRFHGDLNYLSDPLAFESLAKACRAKEWVVYAKPPFGGPEKVLDYLGRYTHRIAISNHRLIEMNNGRVTFTWKNYKENGQRQTMTLDAYEFIRRFLLHVLPDGFVRMRYYGLLANCHRARELQRCRELLNVSGAPDTDTSQEQTWVELLVALTGKDPLQCPKCKDGRLVRIQTVEPSSSFHERVTPKAHSP